MFNKVILVGRLTRDPELRYTNTGVPVAKYSLAVDRNFKGPGGEKETDFFNIVCWRKLAEISGKYLKKGRLVLVEGRIQMRKYQAQDGSTRTACDIQAEQMQMLESKGMIQEEASTANSQAKSPSHSGSSEFSGYQSYTSKDEGDDFSSPANDDIDFEDVPF